ncbi:MAG: patatin-like phospholipase family protein [Clostridiaceae bacterium]|jgi:NTE family protein|nr:patatin-like phospholipase family protein [Clostridiaceae bacterium]
MRENSEGQKLGLILEGGGAKGAFHIGALKLLFERGYHFDGIAGTSIGALNGAFVAEDAGLDKAMLFWDDIGPSDFLDIDDETFAKYVTGEKPIDRSVIAYIGRLLPVIGRENEIISVRMREFLAKYIDEEAVRNSGIDFGIVAYSVSDFKAVEIMKEEMPEGELGDYIIASANFPVFKLYDIGGKRFTDGGIWDNLPINLLARKGYKRMCVIRTGTKPPKRKLEYGDLDLTYIVPSEKLGLAMVFTRQVVEHNMMLGYFDAMRALDGLNGKNFYIAPCADNAGKELLEKMPVQFYVYLLNALKRAPSSEQGKNAGVVEAIIRDALDMPERFTSTQVLLNFFELFALIFKPEKFRIYEFADFVTASSEAASDYIFDRENFFKRVKAVKNDALKEIFYAFAVHFCNRLRLDP